MAKDKEKKKDKKGKKPGKDKKLAKAAKQETAASPGPMISPLAPDAFPDLPQIAGAEFASAAAGVKYKGRTDVMLVRLAPGTAIGGAFTRSTTRAACVLDCQAKLSGEQDSSHGAAIVVNSIERISHSLAAKRSTSRSL